MPTSGSVITSGQNLQQLSGKDRDALRLKEIDLSSNHIILFLI